MVEGGVMSAGLHGIVSLPDQRAGRASAITCGESLESCVTGRKTRVTGKCLAHSIPEAGRLAEVECWREQPYRPTTGQTPQDPAVSPELPGGPRDARTHTPAAVEAAHLIEPPAPPGGV